MIHGKRKFSITDVGTAGELATDLTQHTWTLCTGFRHGGYLFLNDSFGPDGAQEYAVIRESDGVQVESITFSWCDEGKAREYIEAIVAGTLGKPFGDKFEVRQHEGGSCHNCA